jgi:hypothetical protein
MGSGHGPSRWRYPNHAGGRIGRERRGTVAERWTQREHHKDDSKGAGELMKNNYYIEYYIKDKKEKDSVEILADDVTDAMAQLKNKGIGLNDVLVLTKLGSEVWLYKAGEQRYIKEA